MKTLTLATLFLLAACDQSTLADTPPRLHVRQGILCEISRADEGMGMRYRCTDATGFRTMLVEIRYSGGAGEVWAVPHNAAIAHATVPALCRVYPALFDVPPTVPKRIKENADGSIQTTTGGKIEAGRATVYQGNGYASWLLE